VPSLNAGPSGWCAGSLRPRPLRRGASASSRS
jgi:hypothetical protein